MLLIRVYTVLDQITITVASTLTHEIVGPEIRMPVLYSLTEQFAGDDCVEEITDRIRQALAYSDGYAADLIDHVQA